MQPVVELSLTRPWHWGIAIVGDPAADIPDIDTGSSVTIGAGNVIVAVRHAQDIDPATYNDDPPDLTTSTIHIRVIGEHEAHCRAVSICDTVIDTPTRAVTIGDAVSELVLTSMGSRTRVVASALDGDLAGFDVIWLDLIPLDG